MSGRDAIEGWIDEQDEFDDDFWDGFDNSQEAFEWFEENETWRTPLADILNEELPAFMNYLENKIEEARTNIDFEEDFTVEKDVFNPEKKEEFIEDTDVKPESIKFEPSIDEEIDILEQQLKDAKEELRLFEEEEEIEEEEDQLLEEEEEESIIKSIKSIGSSIRKFFRV